MKTRLPIKVLPIQGDGYHLLVDAQVIDTPVRMVVDSGASRTVFDAIRIQSIIPDVQTEPLEHLSSGLGTNSLQGQKVNITSLRIGDLHIVDYIAVLLDLQHINASYQMLGIEEIDGVLGSDVLLKYQAVIDYGREEIVMNIPT